MREVVLDYLKRKKYKPTTYDVIADNIKKLDSNYSLNEIYQTLVKLENEHYIIRDAKDNISSVEGLGLILGSIDIKRNGYGFVRPKNKDIPDIFVGKDDLNYAIDKDLVLVKIKQNRNNNSTEGKIVKVLEHGHDIIVGTIIRKGSKYFVTPDDVNLSFSIYINDKNLNGGVEGNKVVCYITKVNREKRLFDGKIKYIIGHINDVGIDILSVVYQLGFNPIFTNKALKEAQSFQEISSLDGFENRYDLTNKVLFTIDGSDAKDLDDAVGLELQDNGNVKLYVSIADVSHYVQPKSELNAEAYARSTSVYLADRVVPMLPHALSNGICSLLPQRLRLTMTCEMTFNPNGVMVDHQIYESIIKTKYRLTYNEVNKMLMDEDEDTINKYEDIYDILKQMLVLSKQLREQKVKRGMLDFDIPEPKLIVNKNGKVVDIIARERFEAERLIEDFMIVANETVATHINKLNLPFIYRVHDKPNPERMKDFIKFVATFNIKYQGNIDNISNQDVQVLLSEIHKNHDLDFMNRLMLKSMAKAVYQPLSIGHFGLGSKCYTHFTSPIRRYPDLIVHRLLRKYLVDKDLNLNNDKLIDSLEKIGEHTSKKERDAIEAEREVNDLKMCEYMLDKIGNEYPGQISSVTNFGLFIELENTVEGLVHVSELPGHFIYHSASHMFINETTSKQYRLGQKVVVGVNRVDIERRQIDFIIKEKNGEL